MAKTQRHEDDSRFSERDNPGAKIWDHYPDEWVVEDLRQHVIKTGKPDEWKWHCHSMPPAGSFMPEVIAEDISVPERLHTVVGAAPCPLCSLRGPKYFHGMLVWYRQEKALRVIGHECARKFYGTGFDAEIAASRMKREDNSTLSFLIDNLYTVRELRKAVEILLPRSRYLDKVRTKVISAITKKTAKQIYNHAHLDGLLKLYEITSLHIIKSNAEEATKSEVHVAGSVPCRSAQMLVHGDKLSEALLSRADQVLALLDHSNDDAILAALSALGIEGRAKAGKDLYAAWDLLIQAHELCKETQQFLEMSNLSNLVSWANDRRAQISLKCSIDPYGRVSFANRSHRYLLIPSSAELTEPLPTIPGGPFRADARNRK